MSALSSVSLGSMMRQSPLQRLQAELSSEVSAGTISASDKDALSSALTSIDSSIKSEMQSAGASGARPSPDQMKSKIDDLIAKQVDSGALTSDQASELKNVFANAMPQGGPGGGGGPGGPGGPGGAGGPPPMGMNDNDGDDSSTSSTSSSSSSSSTSDIQKLLEDFMKSLQEKLNSSSSSYSASGQSGSFTAALLVDFKS